MENNASSSQPCSSPGQPEARIIKETLHPYFQVSLTAERVLFEERTSHQDMILFENRTFGKVLLLDGAIQVTTADEFMYHEMMAHVPLFAHPAPHNVLIIGGGDCGLAEEVLKHRSVEKVTQVEIDSSVVAFSKKYFSEFNAPVFSDSRFVSKIADGAVFLQETQETFDIILVDSTDPVGPAEMLFSKDFYRAAKNCLSENGILIKQNGVPFLQKTSLFTAVRDMSCVYQNTGAYILAVPSYVGGHMTLTWACQTQDLPALSLEELRKRFISADIETRYYTPEVHTAAFALPRYIAQTVEAGKQAAPDTKARRSFSEGGESRRSLGEGGSTGSVPRS